VRLEVVDNHRSRFSSVPSGWRQRRMRFAVACYQTLKNEDENPTVLSLTKSGLKVKTDLSFGKSTENYVGHQVVKKGQFVFTPRDFDATPILCGVAEVDGCISNLYIVFDVSSHIDSRFLEYYFWGLKYGFSLFEKLSFGMRYSFNRTQFENIPLLHPDLTAQKAIARFLDRETARIDQLITKKLRLVELLEEREQNNLIQVFAGLTSDSLIWKVSHLCLLQRGRFNHRPRNAPELYDGEHPFLQTGDVARAKKYIRTFKQTLTDLGASVSAKFPKGTVLMAIAANVGDVAISEFDAFCPDSVVGFVPSKRLDKEFLYYALRSLRPSISTSSTSNAQDNTNIARLGALKVPLPELSIQRKAVETLDQAETRNHALVSHTTKSVERLREFRSALITAAVTGQIDVTTWAKQGQTDRRLDEIEKAMRA
jgi:type I restriction enzyme, S subunit